MGSAHADVVERGDADNNRVGQRTPRQIKPRATVWPRAGRSDADGYPRATRSRLSFISGYSLETWQIQPSRGAQWVRQVEPLALIGTDCRHRQGRTCKRNETRGNHTHFVGLSRTIFGLDDSD